MNTSITSPISVTYDHTAIILECFIAVFGDRCSRRTILGEDDVHRSPWVVGSMGMGGELDTAFGLNPEAFKALDDACPDGTDDWDIGSQITIRVAATGASYSLIVYANGMIDLIWMTGGRRFGLRRNLIKLQSGDGAKSVFLKQLSDLQFDTRLVEMVDIMLGMDIDDYGLDVEQAIEDDELEPEYWALLYAFTAECADVTA